MIIFYSGHVQNGTPDSKVSFIQVLNKNIGFAFLLLTSPVQLPLDDFCVVIDNLATDALSRVSPEYSFAILLLKTQGYLFFIKLISIMCVDSTEPFYLHKSFR